MKSSVIQKIPFFLLSTVTALVAVGCGGGGDEAAPSEPPVLEAPVEPAAVTSVAPGTYSDARRKSAFDRLNEVRAAAGVGLVAQNLLIDQAAQSHSFYLNSRGIVGHGEVFGDAGFTGESALSRIFSTGYAEFNWVSEVAAEISYNMNIPDDAGKNLVDSLMGTPFHRSAMLAYHPSEVGVGVANDGASATITIDLTSSNSNRQGAPNTPVAIWPPADSVDIPTTMHSEVPNPIPENGNAPAGYPVSVHTNTGFRAIDVTRFEIRDEGDNLIDTKILSYNNGTSNGDRSFAAALPRAPLQVNKKYIVIFEGIIFEQWNGAESAFKKTWSFSTGNKIIY